MEEVDIEDRLEIILPAITQLTDITTNFAAYTGFTDSGGGNATASSVDCDGKESVWRRWLYDGCFRWLRDRLRVVTVSNQTATNYFRLAAHISGLALRANVCSREANSWLSYASMMERLLTLTNSSTFCPQISPELPEDINLQAGVQLARHLFSSIICPALQFEDAKLPFSPARVSAFQALLYWLCGHSTRDACFPQDDLIWLYLFEAWLKDSQPASATLLSTLDDLLRRLHRNPGSCSGSHAMKTPMQLCCHSDSSCIYWDVWDSGLGRLGFLLRLLSESLLPTVLYCCSVPGDADHSSLASPSWDAMHGQAAMAFAIVVRIIDLVDFIAIPYSFGRLDLAEFVYCLRRTVSVLRTVFSKFSDTFSSDNRSETLADTAFTKLELWALNGECLRKNLDLETVLSFTVNTLHWLQHLSSLALQPGVLLPNKDLMTAETAQLNTSSNSTVYDSQLSSLFMDGVQMVSMLATKTGLVDSAALPLLCILVELVATLCPKTNGMRNFMNELVTFMKIHNYNSILKKPLTLLIKLGCIRITSSLGSPQLITSGSFPSCSKASMEGEAGQICTDLVTNQLPQWIACSVRRHFTSSRLDHTMVLGLSLSLPFPTANSCLRQVIVDSPSATNKLKSITAMLVKCHRLQPLIYTPTLVKGVLDLWRRAQWDTALRPYGLRVSRRDPRSDLVLQHLIDMVPTLSIPSSTKPLPPVDLLAKFCAFFKQDLWAALLNHLRILLCPPDFNEATSVYSTQQCSQPQPETTLKVGEVPTFTPNPLAIAIK
ncbi:unnamed protein product [Dibothriocephalus latus]|uniref:Uncharacterized protein n=1 Tax=Dibothriocephalus latus TaxID=60516 RepID=A0A3P7NNH5_DIBLA|nr:unnamed protein product [Dibothriocephalus latus]